MAKTKQEKLEAKAEREYYRKHKSQIKKTPGDRVFDVINYTIFAIFTLICIFPFYYLFINTISDNNLVQRGLINFWPRGVNFDNYIRIQRGRRCGAGLSGTGSLSSQCTLTQVLSHGS